MTDKLRKLIKQLPPVEPERESVDKLIKRIIRREMRRLWEKRLSLASGITSILLGILIVREAVKIGQMLDTIGFWRLIFSDVAWLAKDREAVFLALVEANPIKEIFYLILLLATLIFSLYILLRKDE